MRTPRTNTQKLDARHRCVKRIKFIDSIDNLVRREKLRGSSRLLWFLPSKKAAQSLAQVLAGGQYHFTARGR